MSVIIITGASKGIGKAILMESLTQFDAKVVAIARNKTLLDELSQYVSSSLNKGGQLEIVVGDVTEERVLLQAVNKAIEKWGRLDSVIANAGISEPFSTIATAQVEEWKKLYNTNVFSVVALASIAMPYLRKSDKGSIIIVSSGVAYQPVKGVGAYGSSKAAVNHIASTLSVEEPNITTIALGPGAVDTDMQIRIRENAAEAMQEYHTIFMNLYDNNQLVKPELPAYVIAALASNPPKELSGKMCGWDDEELQPYRRE